MIYKITSPTGKVYIGQTWWLSIRKRKYKGLHCKKQQKLYESLNKYGWEAHTFEIVHELPQDVCQEVLDSYETFYWKQHIDCGFEMMNLREPGNGGKYSEESRKKMSESAKKRIRLPFTEEHIRNNAAARKGFKHTEETKNKLSEINKGKTHSEETKKKLSKLHKGRKFGPMSEETKVKLSKSKKGKPGTPHTEETKKKLSEKHKGVPKSEETKDKIKESRKHQDMSSHFKPIICNETGEKFKSIKEASEILKIHDTCISSVLKGKLIKYRGLSFSYIPIVLPKLIRKDLADSK